MFSFFTTTRITGLLYLGLCITGIYAFLVTKSQLYVPHDAAATSVLLSTKQDLARAGIATEVALVAFQAVLALWFYKLFVKYDAFAALCLATFGTINAVIILVASVFWLTALSQAISTNPDNNTVLLLFELHEAAWLVGQLFFGLWLIPMGYLASLAKMPKILGWILIAGGLGYVAALFLSILAPTASPTLIQNLPVLATIGELWMIGYLLFKSKLR